jgi:uncharacterized protein
MAIALARAFNEYREDVWLASDDRWYSSITTAYENPESAVEEIRRCKEDSSYPERWVQVLLTLDNLQPAGNPRYWPIYEAAEHYGLPVAFHVLAFRRQTGLGSTNFYFEEHTNFAQWNFPTISSLVFEGVFDRFPRLQIALIELAWSWVVPFMWRLDASWRKLRAEVPHLQRKPSEYIREHFWYSTQPIEEPESLEWFDDLYGLREANGIADRIMYSSDYPHWDFDAPEALPATLPLEARRGILGVNASRLYGISLRPGTGYAVC